MTLIKTGLLNGIAVAVRLLTSLVLNKVLAVYIGPSGFAMIGQFLNFIALVTTFANGAINSSVTKYTAEYNDDEIKQQAVWKAACAISLVGSLVASLLVALFYKPLAMYFLGDAQYESIMLWFAATLTIFVFNTLLLSIINGKKEIRILVVANILSSLIGAALSAFLATKHGLYGALLALTVSQAVLLFVPIFLCRNLSWFRPARWFGRPESGTVVKLAKFALMAIVSAAVVPLVQILIRNHLTDNFGLTAAGYWQAMTKISDMYLALITGPLAVYYLPRIAEIRLGKELKHELVKGYALLLPLTAICAFFIYLERDIIVATIFTREFLPMRDLFAWQMAGDVVKIASWLLGYVLVGQAMIRVFIVTEVLFSGSLVVLTMLFTSKWGLVGVTMAYLTNYALYLICIAYFVRKRVRTMNQLQPAP